MNDLDDLRSTLRAFRDERDWQQFHTLKDLAAALAIEAPGCKRSGVRLTWPERFSIDLVGEEAES